MTQSTYRSSFASQKSAESYDSKVYGPQSVAQLWWTAEAQLLDASIKRLFGESLKYKHYLDFACGTGRITHYLHKKVASTTGIDVSPFMLERAKQRVPSANFICKDITEQSEDIEGRYDLITAFRFLANAEEKLRITALAGLRARMRDRGSYLLINNHGNPFSFRFLFLPVHWTKDRLASRQFTGYLTNAHTRYLLGNAGFVVEDVIGSGFIPGKLHSFLPYGFSSGIENRLAGRSAVQRLGVNQLFICRLK